MHCRCQGSETCVAPAVHPRGFSVVSLFCTSSTPQRFTPHRLTNRRFDGKRCTTFAYCFSFTCTCSFIDRMKKKKVKQFAIPSFLDLRSITPYRGADLMHNLRCKGAFQGGEGVIDRRSKKEEIANRGTGPHVSPKCTMHLRFCSCFAEQKRRCKKAGWSTGV